MIPSFPLVNMDLNKLKAAVNVSILSMHTDEWWSCTSSVHREHTSLCLTRYVVKCCQLDRLQQPRPKIQDLFVLWVALQATSLIHIFLSSPTRRPKRQPFLQMGLHERDTHIWVMPLLALKMGLPYRYSVGGYMYYVGDLFWVWVLQRVSHWRRSY